MANLRDDFAYNQQDDDYDTEEEDEGPLFTGEDGDSDELEEKDDGEEDL